jgi:hypothetical protein
MEVGTVSVTLRLSDGDAKLAAQLLADIATYGREVLKKEETTITLRQIERTLGSAERVKQATEIAAAFNVSVRSNSPR